MGSTTYRVRVHFSAAGTETAEDKILRLVRNEAMSGQKRKTLPTETIETATLLWYNKAATNEPVA
jgi:hypothetical protein